MENSASVQQMACNHDQDQSPPSAENGQLKKIKKPKERKKPPKPVRSLTDADYEEIFAAVVQQTDSSAFDDLAEVEAPVENIRSPSQKHCDDRKLEQLTLNKEESEHKLSEVEFEEDNTSPLKQKAVENNITVKNEIGTERDGFDNSQTLTQSQNSQASQEIWVQCGRASCSKWRLLSNVRDPCEIPEEWKCSMHPDEAFNDCIKAEQAWTEETHKDFIYTPYTLGSLVWAKMTGYCWWPAMIQEDPDSDLHLKCALKTNIANFFHVMFFGQPVSRSWMNIGSLKPFREECCIPEPGSISKQKKLVACAREMAMKASQLSIQDRLKQYDFVKLYNKERHSLDGNSSNKRADNENPKQADNNEEPSEQRLSKYFSSQEVQSDGTDEDFCLEKEGKQKTPKERSEKKEKTGNENKVLGGNENNKNIEGDNKEKGAKKNKDSSSCTTKKKIISENEKKGRKRTKKDEYTDKENEKKQFGEKKKRKNETKLIEKENVGEKDQKNAEKKVEKKEKKIEKGKKKRSKKTGGAEKDNADHEKSGKEVNDVKKAKKIKDKSSISNEDEKQIIDGKPKEINEKKSEVEKTDMISDYKKNLVNTPVKPEKRPMKPVFSGPSKKSKRVFVAPSLTTAAEQKEKEEKTKGEKAFEGEGEEEIAVSLLAKRAEQKEQEETKEEKAAKKEGMEEIDALLLTTVAEKKNQEEETKEEKAFEKEEKEGKFEPQEDVGAGKELLQDLRNLFDDDSQELDLDLEVNLDLQQQVPECAGYDSDLFEE